MLRYAIAVLCCLSPAAAYALTHEVQMLTRGAAGAMIYVPSHLKIAPGDSVTFLPVQGGHNAASIGEMMPEGAEPFMGQINEEITVSFDVPGRYGIKCSPHYAMGMVMVIDVGEGANASASELPEALPARARARFEEILAD